MGVRAHTLHVWRRGRRPGRQDASKACAGSESAPKCASLRGHAERAPPFSQRLAKLRAIPLQPGGHEHFGGCR